MLDACGVEHVIETMQRGHVQCSRPGCAGLRIRNYRRRELQLLLGASDAEEGRSSTSERGPGGPLSDAVSGQENDLAEDSEEMAEKEPYQGSSDET